jgi:hypothetical protein
MAIDAFQPLPPNVRPWTRAQAWEQTLAGPELAAELATIDVETLSDAECLSYARSLRRQQAWTDALLVATTARFAASGTADEPAEEARPGCECDRALGGEGAPLSPSFAAAEWGAGLGMTTYAARRLMADALDLVHRLPGVTQAMGYGWCDLARARMVAAATRDLSAETTGLVQQHILPILSTLTPQRLRDVIAQLAAALEPTALEARAEAIRDRREVWIDATNDDHAEVSATIDTVDAQRLERRLDFLARLLGIAQGSGQPGFGPGGESWQQRRARALGLLADPATVAALVRVTSSPGAADEPVETGCGLRPTTVYLHVRADGTCDVEGHGTISIPTVRELLASSTVTVRPVIDLNESHASTGYQPSGTVDEAVVLTNERCVFPHCDRPARQCQRDHTVPWPHGPTSSDNMGPLCIHHHQVKTAGRWRVHRAAAGVYVWHSPAGALHVVTPHGTTRL